MHGETKIRKVNADFSDADLFNRAYIPMLYNESEFLHFFGSAGSGKSRFIVQKEIIESFEPSRHNRKTLIVRKVGVTLKDSVYAELKTVIYEWNYQDHFEILKSPLQIKNKLTGVTFLFIGLDDVEKVKSISGVDRIWIEEATELASMSELDQLRLRMRGFDKVQVSLSYNPINKFHWLSTEIHEKLPPGHFIFKTTYRDNEKMLANDPNYATYIESLKVTNPNYYKVYGLGEWGQNAEGLIYPDYEVVADMPSPAFYGLDFGYNDPCALVEGRIIDYPGEDKKRLYLNERLYETRLTADGLVNALNSIGINKDLPMICDNARPEMIEALRKAKYFVAPCEKGPNSVKAGINAVQQFNIKILAGSTQLLREISNYSWAQKDGVWLDKPQEGADHLCDAARYGVTASRAFPRPENLSPADEMERMVPAAYRLDAIKGREIEQPVEQTERELASHNAYIGLGQMLKRKREEDSESEGYFSL